MQNKPMKVAIVSLTVIRLAVTILLVLPGVYSLCSFLKMPPLATMIVLAVVLLAAVITALVVGRHKQLGIAENFVSWFSFQCRRERFLRTKGVSDWLPSADRDAGANYKVFDSDDRLAIRLKLHGGYRRAYDETTGGRMDRAFKPCFLSIVSPAHAGLRTLLQGEARNCPGKKAAFLVSETTWLEAKPDPVSGKTAYDIKSDFKDRVNELVRGFGVSPTILLVLRSDALWLNRDDARKALIENVRNWYDESLNKKKLTIVLKFGSASVVDTSDSVTDELHLRFMNAKECGALAHELDPDWFEKKTREFEGDTDAEREKALCNHLRTETRGVPAALVELINPTFKETVCKIVLSQWEAILTEQDVRNADDRKAFFAAFCFLSLLKGLNINLNNLAKMIPLSQFSADVKAQIIKRFLEAYLGREAIDAANFEVSTFTDAFPEEAVIRCWKSATLPQEYHFGGALKDIVHRAQGYLSKTTVREVFCANALNAFCPSYSPLGDVPDRLTSYLDFLDSTQNQNLIKTGKSLVSTFLDDFMMKVLNAQIIPDKLYSRLIGENGEKSMPLGERLELGDQLKLMAQVACVEAKIYPDPVRWRVDYDFLLTCCRDEKLITPKMAENVFFSWAHAWLIITCIIGHGASDQAGLATKLLSGPLNEIRLWLEKAVKDIPTLQDLLTSVICLSECNAESASLFYASGQIESRNHLANAIVACCHAAEQCQKKSSSSWASIHRYRLALRFDINALAWQSGHLAYDRVTQAIQSLAKSLPAPFAEIEERWCQIEGLSFQDPLQINLADWQTAVEGTLAFWNVHTDNSFAMFELFRGCLYSFSRLVQERYTVLDKAWMTRQFDAFLKQLAVVEEDYGKTSCLFPCACIVRLFRANTPYTISPTRFRRIARSLVHQFRMNPRSVFRCNATQLFEVAAYLYETSGDVDERNELESFFMNSRIPVDEPETNFKAGFLSNFINFGYAYICSGGSARNLIQRALDVWQGQDGSDWHEFAEVKPAKELGNQLPDGLWWLAVHCVVWESPRAGKIGDPELVNVLTKGLDTLEQNGLIPKDAWKNLLDKLLA